MLVLHMFRCLLRPRDSPSGATFIFLSQSINFCLRGAFTSSSQESQERKRCTSIYRTLRHDTTSPPHPTPPHPIPSHPTLPHPIPLHSTPHRTAPHRTAPHRTAPHRTATAPPPHRHRTVPYLARCLSIFPSMVYISQSVTHVTASRCRPLCKAAVAPKHDPAPNTPTFRQQNKQKVGAQGTGS